MHGVHGFGTSRRSLKIELPHWRTSKQTRKLFVLTTCAVNLACRCVVCVISNHAQASGASQGLQTTKGQGEISQLRPSSSDSMFSMQG